MPPRLPTPSDFPSTLTLSITPPSTTTRAPSTALILLHGLGDTSTSFTNLARALNLPETVCLAIQAPTPLPFGLGGFHWADDLTFDEARADGGVDGDAGFDGAKRVLWEGVVRKGLVGECGFTEREVLVWGFGQGGVVALLCAVWAAEDTATGSIKESELGGVIAVGGGLSASVDVGSVVSRVKARARERERDRENEPQEAGSKATGKNRTPVLIIGGSSRSAVTTSAVQRVKSMFEFVQVQQYKRAGDAMPANRDEMLPIMQFLARRLKSRAGVPEGSIEIS